MVAAGSALYGVLAEIEAHGLDLLEVRPARTANHRNQVTAGHRDGRYRRAHQSLLREGEAPMTSAPVRDALADHLLTPENAAFLLIDYQPSQLAAVQSMDPALLLKNAVSTVRTIKTFGVPVVHSTVNVASGQGPTLPELAGLLAEDKPLDRTTVNSWEDPRIRPGRARDRPQEADHLRAVDRSLHGLYCPGCAARRV